jgi:outer membrane receptor protein involved in Fe transport
MQLADAEGRYLAVPYNYRISYVDTVGHGQLLDWRFRPLEEPGLADRMDVARTVQLGLNLGYRFTSWLNATVNYQYTIQTNDYWNFESVQRYNTRSRINRYTNLSQTNPALRNPIPIGGILSTRSNKAMGQNLRGALNWEKTVGKQHRISGMVAADISNFVNGPGESNTFYNYNKDNGTYAQNIDYTNYFPQFPAGSVQRIPLGSNYISESFTRFVAFSGNVLYSYKARYSLYASARKDGSNIFGVNTNNKWKPLWSVGSSWDISKEKFYHIAWMPSLRVRATYGFAGNPGPNDVSGLPVIQYSPTPAPNTSLPQANIRNAPNPDLRWEKVRTINAGVDFSLLNNRISGGIDVWQKVSTDIISSTLYPPASGVFTYVTNSANLKSNGFEIKLSTLNIKGPFEWQSVFGFSHAKTIVTKLHFIPRVNASYYLFFGMNPAEGQMLYGISSFKWAGLDPNTGDPRGYLNKQISTDYNGITGDSIQNQVFHGSSIPLYSGFVGNTFRYKNFSLSANITYKLKYFFRKPAVRYVELVENALLHPDYSKRWQKPGDEQFTNVPSFTYPLNSQRDQFYEFAEINVLPGDHIKLQDVRLQYDWVNTKKGKAMIKGFQLYLYANDLNLLLWTKSKEKLDPEIIGVTRWQQPPTPKSYTAGVSLNF